MYISDMKEAIEEAESTLTRADNVVSDMSYILVNRMEMMPKSVLAIMKRKLKSFNAHTWTWIHEK